MLLLLGYGPSLYAQSTRPCDIYGSASTATPCVAAFSTTRALFVGHTGPLYQVTRQSDGTTTNVGTLPDGYANASIQDAFCSATTCTITKIYDQTSNHNDLTPAPPGQNGLGVGPNNYDLPASATSLPLVVGGHKVYGVFISAGLGYRNDVTTGIATHGQPEGVYMVSSVLALPPSTPGFCCFDFGNAETTNNDDGYGTMDAMNLILVNGVPAAGLDVENGIIGFLPVTAGTQFVTAMGWNNGSTNFDVYWGNAQSGTLTSTGSRKLPANYYGHMNQEGGIILGIGGDNSNYAPGHFFEGVMTTGTPSDASMNAVQANIVAAGYQGAPVTLVNGGTYTFQNEKSQLALDNSSGGNANGVAVVQNAFTGSTPQQWTLHAVGNGYFTVESKQSGLYLDDPYENGIPSRQLPQSQGTSTMLWQQPHNGDIAQNWLFVPQSDSSFVIVNQAATTNQGGPNVLGGAQMVIDDYYGGATQGLQMWLTTANGLPPQRWIAALAPNTPGNPSGTISDGATYTLQNEASQQLLGNSCDGCSGGPTNGIAVIQNSANGGRTQQWTLHSQPNGFFTMVSTLSGVGRRRGHGGLAERPTASL